MVKYEEWRATLKALIEKDMQDNKLSRTEFAAELGTYQQTVGKWLKGISEPGPRLWPCNPHRFRRTFALWMLRDGCDLHTLRLFMGHSDLTVLQRYLAIAGEDLERAHREHGPVDRLLDANHKR